ncbi:hypothetical protein F5882DRAFT_428622 [Hyaloscypha sp. PMI_1271]|nr:hypothetical protein F5882DRAFT_428622 [Hyaloscypha sp. PMI_1271]
MSRDPYRSSGELRYPPRGGERWDSERLERERRSGGREEFFEERDSRFLGPPRNPRARERSVDEIYERERRGPRGYEDDRYERRVEYHDEPRFERERPIGRDRGPSVTIEKEREREREYVREDPPARPAFLRRQSSLDTFDRKPMTRYVERDIRERDEYGPPARYREDARQVPLAPLTPVPLPRSRGLPPPRRYAERDYYDEIEIAEPDYYGDGDYRRYPERVREREIIRTKRRSRSRESRSHKGSVRSISPASSTSSESVTTVSVKSEFPKKGKTRMPARLVSKKAIIDLGYPFEEEGNVIIIQKALGRENIDEVIKLSEDYKSSEKIEIKMSGGRSEAGTVIEERRQEVFTIPPPPPGNFEVIKDTKITEIHRDHSPARSHHHHHHHDGAVILDAHPREESTFVETKREWVEHSDPIPVGPLALAIQPDRYRPKDERAIRAEIKALEAEKEALRAEKRAEREFRKADRIRRGGRASETDLVLYETDRYEAPEEEYMVVRRERIEEPEGGVRIEKDRKGKMSISVPKYYLK